MSEIRNVAIMSHSGAGKTSLLEAMLFRSKMIDSLGKVENGNTASDYTDEEKDRKISIYTTIHPLEWQGKKFNLLDAPGYADFAGEIRGSQAAADGAIIVVSAASGVAVGTERVWASSEERELNRLIVVNKMDRENADFFRVMADLESSLGSNIAAAQLPLGKAESFNGIIDLVHMKAYSWQDGERKEIEIPADKQSIAEEYRARLIEAVVETNDELMEKYLEDLEISDEEIENAFYEAVKANELAPVLVASATEVMGIGLLLDFMSKTIRYVEDHKSLPVKKGDTPILGSNGPFLARVFKTVIDPYMGKVSYMRILSGSLKPKEEALDSTNDETIKVAHLYSPNGKKLEEVSELKAGMIGAFTKMENISTGDTICSPENIVELEPLKLPSPVMAEALHPKNRADEDKLSGALHKLLDEDPTYVLERNTETHETVLWGMGHVHLAIAIAKLKNRYNVEVETSIPKITYRETIVGRGDARYRHKKQSGGAGQFGEVALRVEPLPTGGGFEFVSEVVGGAIPSQFLPSCEKGIEKSLAAGPIAGYKVVDVKATVYDGKHHPVDSKDIAFQAAAANAFKDAMQQAKPVLLEPIMLIKVRVPDRFTGDVIGDLNTRRGRILGMDNEGSVSVISANVPLAEVQTYSPELRSMTGGRGVFSLRFDHYSELPQHLVAGVVAKSKEED